MCCVSSCPIVNGGFLNCIMLSCNLFQSIIQRRGLNSLFNRSCLSGNWCCLRYVINLSCAEDLGEASAGKVEFLPDKFLNGLIAEAFLTFLLDEIFYLSWSILTCNVKGIEDTYCKFIVQSLYSRIFLYIL